jgi:hypothetical protein
MKSAVIVLSFHGTLLKKISICGFGSTVPSAMRSICCNYSNMRVASKYSILPHCFPALDLPTLKFGCAFQRFQFTFSHDTQHFSCLCCPHHRNM